MDLVGWIFAVEDVATRWTEQLPLASASATACAKTLVDEIILRNGTPRMVIGDNGPQFVSSVIQKVAHLLRFKQTLNPSYNPASKS